MDQFLSSLQAGFSLADTKARRKREEEEAEAMRSYRQQMGEYYTEQAESNRMLRQAQADKLAREAAEEIARNDRLRQTWMELNPEGLDNGAVSNDVLQSRFDRMIFQGMGEGWLPAKEYMPYIRTRTDENARRLAKEADAVPLRPELIDIGGVQAGLNPNTGAFKFLPRSATEKDEGMTEAQRAMALMRLTSAENNLMRLGLETKDPAQKRNLRAQMDNLQKERERIESGNPTARSSMDQTPAPAQVTGSPSSPNLREIAAKAIQDGKDPIAVKRRFKELTGEDY